MIKFRDATDADMNFVWSSWLKSFRASKYAGALPGRIYHEAYKDAIEILLQRIKLTVAYDPDEQNPKLNLVGWLASEGRTVHYLYVKEHGRRQGVARALLCMVGIEYPMRFVYSYKTPAWADFLEGSRWSATHDPWRARDDQPEDKGSK